MKPALMATVAAIGLCLSGEPIQAQSISTGQIVYATPSGATNDWYSGCVVKDGRSNDSFQVECSGTVYWISREHIRTTPPQAMPDPMRPGHTLVPVVTRSTTAPARGVGLAARAPARTPATRAARSYAQINGGVGPGSYADGMAARIAQDKVEAANAVLRPGKYSCYSMGQYTFVDLYITGPYRYTVKPGGSGSFSYAKGALTFASGPYAGAYSRMVDGHTIGISARGNTNLGTQCGFDG